MYIAVVPNRNSPPAILLRESFRVHGKVKTRTLANISHWPPAQIEALRQLLKGEFSAGGRLRRSALAAPWSCRRAARHDAPAQVRTTAPARTGVWGVLALIAQRVLEEREQRLIERRNREARLPRMKTLLVRRASVRCPR
jgi:hypothetical protein